MNESLKQRLLAPFLWLRQLGQAAATRLRQLGWPALGGRLKRLLLAPALWLRQLGQTLELKLLGDVPLKQRLLAASSRIWVRLYLSIGGAVALTFIASWVAWISFTRIGEVQTSINEHIPDMVTAFLVARQGNDLAVAAPRLTQATSPEDFEDTRKELSLEIARFAARLEELNMADAMVRDQDEIRLGAEALIANIQAIEASVAEAFALNARIQQEQAELLTLQQELEQLLGTAIDDQFFFTITGYTELDQPPAAAEEHRAEAEFLRFRHLMELELAMNLGVQLLASAFNVSDPQFLEPLEERFDGAAAARASRGLAGLAGATQLPPQLGANIEGLRQMGTGADGSFGLQARRLALAERQRQLLASNRQLADRLGRVIEERVGVEMGRSLGATAEAAAAIDSAQDYLLAINLLAVAGAVLISWLYVGRLVGRINLLSGHMRSMATGQLQDSVQMSGHDEVADMAAALEIFRKNSLEAQRLNLVEKQAKEIQEKNEELESVLGKLRNAQEQIVMQEKLAALGELTAGVAHEMKNPLNFVMNFTEGSVELLGELKEALEQAEKGQLSAEQQEEIKDLSDSLATNLESIQRNGERANRIVQDMLGMGRGSDEFQMADINSVLSEHINLAYHAARATDESFQLNIVQDLDPDAGELNMIPHDLGRVFLNMATNACYATHEKRQALAQEGQEGYAAELAIKTRRDGKQLVITLRDNGPGIPKDILADVFNPFFTTKPPDKGTGLGLSLSNDIVVNHGGTIKIDSTPGEFTEVQVTLPTDYQAPKPVAADA